MNQQQPLSFWVKVWYGLGNTGNSVKTVVFSTFLFFYYNQVKELSGTMCGLALFVALCADAINDPLIGIWSDKLKSRWGRRHPMMAIGGLPFAFFLLGLFLPPDNLSQMGLFAWFVGFAILTRTAQTFFQIPYLSMGAEMTDDYAERSNIFSFGQFFGFVGNVVVAGAGYLHFFKSTPQFKNGLLNESSYLPFGFFAAAVILLGSYGSIIGTRSMIPRLKRNALVESERLNFAYYYRSFGQVFKNRSFQVVLGGLSIMLITNGAGESLSTYLFIHFWGFKPEELAIYLGLPFFVGLVIALSISTRMVVWFDKRNTLIISILAVWIITNSMIIFKLLGWLPEVGTWQFLAILMSGVALLNAFAPVFFITLNSIFADIADEIEYETGFRKEGTLFSIRALLTKMATGLGGLIAGLLLDWIHFPKPAEMGTVSPHIVQNLGLVAGPFLSIFSMGAVLIFVRYGMNKNKHIEIRKILSERRKEEKAQVIDNQ